MFVQANRKKSMAEYLFSSSTSPRHLNLLNLKMKREYRGRAACQHSMGPGTQTFSPGEV